MNLKKSAIKVKRLLSILQMKKLYERPKYNIPLRLKYPESGSSLISTYIECNIKLLRNLSVFEFVLSIALMWLSGVIFFELEVIDIRIGIFLWILFLANGILLAFPRISIIMDLNYLIREIYNYPYSIKSHQKKHTIRLYLYGYNKKVYQELFGQPLLPEKMKTFLKEGRDIFIDSSTDSLFLTSISIFDTKDAYYFLVIKDYSQLVLYLRNPFIRFLIDKECKRIIKKQFEPVKRGEINN